MNLYLHVPFCVAKCNYCAFYSAACKNPDWDNWCDGILREIDFWETKFTSSLILHPSSIFFGGGTPSLMPIPIFEKIMNKLTRTSGVEVTLESNPGTLDIHKLNEFKRLGVNRLSIGVQSLDNAELEFLGRRHSVSDARNLITTAADMGLRTSADFIYGLPGHDVGHVANLCEQINKLPIEHCSMYELTIEPNTPFGKMNLKMPDNETMAAMYETIGEKLNLPRYEVSNYGTPCRHNQNIWDGEPYIGLGRGAAGRPFIDGIWYEQSGNFEKFDAMDENSRAIEKIITGMRTTRGVLLTPDVKKLINWDYVSQNSDLYIQNNRICTKNFLILDSTLLDLIK